MNVIAERVGASVLEFLRRRQSLSPHPSSESNLARPLPAIQREVRFSDFESVAALKERWGLGRDTRENWSRLWEWNPALRTGREPLTMGWVLESERGIVGYQGSVPLLYRLGERVLLAATGTSLVVEPAYRGRSIGLLTAFYRQGGVDLLLITTAVPSVCQLSLALRARAVPQSDYGRVLFWVLEPHQFAKAVAVKARVSGAVGTASIALGALALRAESRFWGRRAAATTAGLRVSETPIAMIGDEFEALWRQKRAEKTRLLVDRSPALLRWHFTIPGSAPNAWALCCRSGHRLLGYAIVRHRTEHETGMRRAVLADLLVAGDDREASAALLAAAFDHAVRRKSHVFEIVGFPRNVRDILLGWNPYSRRYPSCPFLYKATDPAVDAILAHEDAWYASPMDGDTTLMP